MQKVIVILAVIAALATMVVALDARANGGEGAHCTTIEDFKGNIPPMRGMISGTFDFTQSARFMDGYNLTGEIRRADTVFVTAAPSLGSAVLIAFVVDGCVVASEMAPSWKVAFWTTGKAAPNWTEK